MGKRSESAEVRAALKMLLGTQEGEQHRTRDITKQLKDLGWGVWTTNQVYIYLRNARVLTAPEGVSGRVLLSVVHHDRIRELLRDNFHETV